MRVELLLMTIVALAGCAPRGKVVSAAEVPKLTSLDDVMATQASAADPQFKKIGHAQYFDGDWAAFADTATRISATSLKIKDFTKGPEFDKLAERLGEKAAALQAAAAAKNHDDAQKALSEMKATCRECHSKFR